MNIYGMYIEEAYKMEKDNQLIQEGIFTKLKNMFNKKTKNTPPEFKYSATQKLDKTTKYGLDNSIVEAIMSYCKAIYGASYNETTKTYSISASKMKQVEKDKGIVYVGKYKYAGSSNEHGYNEYIYNLVEEIESGSIMELIQKHNIKIDVKDTSSMESRRKTIASKSRAIAKKVIAEVAKEDKRVIKGFRINDDEEFYDDFISGYENDLSIIDCDAWGFTDNKARDQSLYEEYDNVFVKIYGLLDKQLKAAISDVVLDYYGDWDDGPIVVIDKKKY